MGPGQRRDHRRGAVDSVAPRRRKRKPWTSGSTQDAVETAVHRQEIADGHGGFRCPDEEEEEAMDVRQHTMCGGDCCPWTRDGRWGMVDSIAPRKRKPTPWMRGSTLDAVDTAFP